jgi:hypothetical protein
MSKRYTVAVCDINTKFDEKHIDWDLFEVLKECDSHEEARRFVEFSKKAEKPHTGRYVIIPTDKSAHAHKKG